VYRLPSDHEWSRAVGLPLEKGATPADQSAKNQEDFPWGRDYPPKKVVGNYADTEYRVDNFPSTTIPKSYTYADGYKNTSPVGSFAANRFGLYDMGGNVWQWCEDWFDKEQKDRVLRGAAWPDLKDRTKLLSSFRYHFVPGPGGRYSIHGFRCVLSVSGVKDSNLAAAPAVPPPAVKTAAANQIAVATKESPFVNSLGMKFAPVPMTGGPTEGRRILVSVWDTRVQDYEIFATDTQHGWAKTDFVQAPTHPAVNLSWDDAQLFCRWLTARELAAGRLPADWKYRLPSDHEWSCAVGIAARERAAMLPVEKSGKITDAFPWGFQWPPPLGAGNYADSLGADKFPRTSPVGSFAPNRFGLRDLGGNVWQWCEDFYIDKDQKDHVMRGASWYHHERDQLLSSFRGKAGPGHYGRDMGFRCVLSETTP
jgi:formylglycine-generating enzyme required for sulfatase activity